MWVTPISLTGKFLRLEPLSHDHIPAFQAYYSAELYKYVSNFPKSESYEDTKAYIDKLVTDPSRCMYAIVLPDQSIAGRTGYLEIRESHRSLEIGTVIFKPYHGGMVNPESKYLLLKHAFETLGAVRVQVKTDSRNTQSQRAVEKLGLVKEGILRKYQTRADGFVRDSVIYSAIDTEWPQIKARLEARLYARGL
jgi:RimJ/RimL family protein N-acetyltransferase